MAADLAAKGFINVGTLGGLGGALKANIENVDGNYGIFGEA